MNNKLRILNRNVSDVCIIGDIHASPNSLKAIVAQANARGINKFISLGDLWDRGTDPNETIELVTNFVKNGQMEMVMGNHDWKFYRHFLGQEVSIKEEQLVTLGQITAKSTELFMDLFSDLPVGMYDPAKKIFISHAGGGRPADILGRDFRKSKSHYFATYNDYLLDKADKLIEKKFVANMLYGMTNGQVTEDGKPVRLPITQDVNDDLEGWTYIFGHIHAANLYPEDGNKRAVCLDWCSGEPGGCLGALIVGQDGEIEEKNLLFANE